MFFVPEGQYRVEVEELDEDQLICHQWESVTDPRFSIEVRYFEGRIIRDLNYKYDGQLHRESGPASISFSWDGTRPILQTWCRHGECHRENGPAEIEHDDVTGNLRYEGFWLDGQPHRRDGPALVHYDADGNIQRQEFLLYGEEVPAFTPDTPDNTMG